MKDTNIIICMYCLHKSCVCICWGSVVGLLLYYPVGIQNMEMQTAESGGGERQRTHGYSTASLALYRGQRRILLNSYTKAPRCLNCLQDNELPYNYDFYIHYLQRYPLSLFYLSSN